MHSLYTVFVRTGVNTPVQGDKHYFGPHITGTANNTEENLLVRLQQCAGHILVS